MINYVSFYIDAKDCFTIAWGKLHYTEGFENAPVQFGFTSVQVKILDKTKNKELNKLGEMGYNLKNIVCTTMGIKPEMGQKMLVRSSPHKNFLNL